MNRMASSHRTIPPADILHRSSLAEVPKELLWREEKRIPLENPANDDRRMRSQNINDRIALKLVQTICADDDIIVIAPQIVHSRFEFNHRIDQRSAPGGPVHPAHDPTARKGMLPVPAGKPLEHRQHAIDVEVSISEVGVCGAPHFELTSLCRSARV